MTMTVTQFEELKPEQEDLETTSATSTRQQGKYHLYPRVIVSPVQSIAQTSAEHQDDEVRDYYLTSYPRSVDLYSFGHPYQLRYIEEKAEDPPYEIAVHTLAQPITGKLASFKASENSPYLQKTTKKVKLQTQRHQELKAYLDSLYDEARAAKESEFSEGVLDIAWLVWMRLRNHFMENKLCLEVPDACPGQKDNFMYTWSKEEHYLECEIFGNGEIEFFYRNRKTGQNWGEDTTLDQVFSLAVFEKAELFTWSFV
jgi:hypothetical protein